MFLFPSHDQWGLIVKATSNANITLQAAQNTAYHAILAAHYDYGTPMTLSGYGGTVLAQKTGYTKTLLYASNAEQIRITTTGVGIGLGGSDPTTQGHIFLRQQIFTLPTQVEVGAAHTLEHLVFLALMKPTFRLPP